MKNSEGKIKEKLTTRFNWKIQNLRKSDFLQKKFVYYEYYLNYD